MGKPEQQRTDEPEDKSASEQVRDSVEQDPLPHFLKENFNLTLKDDLRTSFLFSPNTLFPLLEGRGGLVIQTGGKKERRRQVLYQAGMPWDLEPIDIHFLTLVRGPGPDDFTWGDFALHVSGVRVDYSNKEHGWSGKALTFKKIKGDAKIGVHLWEANIYMRGSSARLLVRYNTGANQVFNVFYNQKAGETIHLLDIDRADEAQLVRLLQARVLLDDVQANLDSAVKEKEREKKAGPKPKATVDDYEIPGWSFAYDEMKNALEADLAARHQAASNRSRVLSGYGELDKHFMIKRAMPDLPSEIIQALARLDRVQDVALQYAGWCCSDIPIGTWGRDRYRDYLEQSDRLNDIKRGKRAME